MCKANDYISNLKNIHDSIGNDIKDMLGELSKLDKLTSDILHKIESGTFSASEGYNYAKTLQLILQKRRKLKNELQPLTQLQNVIEGNEMSTKINKTKIKILKFNNICKQGAAAYNFRVLKNKKHFLDETVQVLNEIDI